VKLSEKNLYHIYFILCHAVIPHLISSLSSPGPLKRNKAKGRNITSHRIIAPSSPLVPPKRRGGCNLWEKNKSKATGRLTDPNFFQERWEVRQIANGLPLPKEARQSNQSQQGLASIFLSSSPPPHKLMVLQSKGFNTWLAWTPKNLKTSKGLIIISRGRNKRCCFKRKEKSQPLGGGGVG